MVLAIRAASAADLDDIGLVHKASIREVCGSYYTSQQVSAWLDALTLERYADSLTQRHVLVAEDDGVVVGFGMADLGSGTMNAIYVSPSRLRQGIGRMLVSALESAIDAGSVSLLRLHSTLNATEFYAALGYVSDGPSENVLPSGVSLPCVAMHKVIGPRTEPPRPADARRHQVHLGSDSTSGGRS